MCMLDTIHAKRDEVRRLARRYNGRAVYVFGSCARKEEGPDSDIDFLVDFAPGTTLFGMAGLQDGLQALFKCWSKSFATPQRRTYPPRQSRAAKQALCGVHCRASFVSTHHRHLPLVMSVQNKNENRTASTT